MENERSIKILYSPGRKQQMKFLSEKYDNLFKKWSKLSETMKYISRTSLLLFVLSTLNIADMYLLSAYPNWILKGSCVVFLALGVISYMIKESFIEIKCSEYAYYSNVTYGIIIRDIERLEKKLNGNCLMTICIVLKENRLYYVTERNEYIELVGKIPNGDIIVSIHPYENVHAWMAEPM